MDRPNNSVAEDTFFQVNKSLRCRGSLLDLSTPKIMGVLNITPDSFHDGGRYLTEKESVSKAIEMLRQGADILDLGAQSTRPGAQLLDQKTEWSRLKNIIPAILHEAPDALLSIDTFYATVAERSIDLGVAFVNDISGGEFDPRILDVVQAKQVPYILMHIKGTPQTMQDNPQYGNVIQDIMDYFSIKIQELKTRGIHDIILDPGFGFGKSVEHNYTLLGGINLFRMTGYPVMAGLSRKSMITRVLNIKNADALNGTTVLNTLALIQGASFLRVHDIKEANEVRTLVSEYVRVQKSEG
ncbi:MAG: dihydropteroate synthase [Bacteroidia bacterium]